MDDNTQIKATQTLKWRAAAADKLAGEIKAGRLRDPSRQACADCPPEKRIWTRGRAYRLYDHPRGYGRPFDVEVVCPQHLDARRAARGEPVGARRGRPVKAEDERRQPIRLTLSRQEIAMLREWGNGNVSAGISHVLKLQGRPQWARAELTPEEGL